MNGCFSGLATASQAILAKILPLTMCGTSSQMLSPNPRPFTLVHRVLEQSNHQEVGRHFSLSAAKISQHVSYFVGSQVGQNEVPNVFMYIYIYDSTEKLRRLQSVCLHFAPIRWNFVLQVLFDAPMKHPLEKIAVLGKVVFKTLEATEAKGIPRSCQLLWLKAC